MRTLLVLGLFASAPAFAQDHPCRDRATFDARRCGASLTEASAHAAEAREAIAALEGCPATKKKSALAACAADLFAAARKLSTATEVLDAAAHAAPPAASDDGAMHRPE
jgi:hypothetical protein